jgi:hypothetical protein
VATRTHMVRPPWSIPPKGTLCTQPQPRVLGSAVEKCGKSGEFRLTGGDLAGTVAAYQFRCERGLSMAGTGMGSLVHQFASMKPAEFGSAIEPKWQLCDRLVKEVRAAVEKQQVSPLDGARVISSITATLFGYDEFILREISAESLLATPTARR